MSSIFTIENIEDFSEKLNIDELYEKKRQYDLKQLELYNKILNRIHTRIKLTSRQKMNEQFCWFLVPEIIIGVPKYDHASCIAYLMDKLKQNGFNVKYIHPNTLFILWNHWVPSYVRSEIKKKTGIIINEYGIKQDENTNNYQINENDNNPLMEMMNMNMKNPEEQQHLQNNKQKKNYTPINSYKPSGNLIYDEELLFKIEEKFS
jgi:hypothetical protein